MTTPNYPKCKHCGHELSHTNYYDMEFETSYATLYWIGFCPKCNIRYQWRADYDVTYEGFRELLETGRN